MPFYIMRNDITKVKADAVVNTANRQPIYADGTDRAIYVAAGEKKLLDARKKIGEIPVGAAAHTPAFQLDAKYIIHTVGPVWRGGMHDELMLLKDCYQNSLELALQLGCRSIAFPLISTGILGVPKRESLRLAIECFSRFLLLHDMDITLVLFDADSVAVSEKLFSGLKTYIDNHYVSEKMLEEYRTGELGLRNFTEYRGVSEARPSRRPESLHISKRRRALKSNAEKAFVVPPVESGTREEKTSGKRSLDDVVKQLSETWQEHLLRLIDEKQMDDVEVYKRANVDRKLFSKIRSNAQYQPKKMTAVAFALALRLNLDETGDFLARAGYALSPSSKFDLIISYFIENREYDAYTINLALFEHDQALLGG